MKSLVLIGVMSAMSFAAFAAGEGAEQKTQRPKTMPPELREKIKEASKLLTGGFVRKPGSAHGAAAFINAQKKVPAEDVRGAMSTIDRIIHPICKYQESSALEVSGVKAEMDRLECKVGVAVIDDAKMPSLLVAPEENWAVVNVAALAKDNPAATNLAARVRKEILRGFALAGGCAFMCRGPVVMTDAAGLGALDEIAYEEYGIDAVNRLMLSLPARGVTPWYQTSYRKACKEGWAASPTNDIQKKIWDKVHELPTTPLKLEK